jgi:hypothetical protein
LAQVVYFFSAAVSVGAPVRRVNFTVPTGNFGDIFAGYIAKRMGLPIDQLVIATNQNDILHRTLQTGAQVKEGVTPSISPSMDIQVSSNFERALFEAYGRDGGVVAAQMDALLVSSHHSALGKPRMNHGCQTTDTVETVGTPHFIPTTPLGSFLAATRNPNSWLGVWIEKIEQVCATPQGWNSCPPQKAYDTVARDKVSCDAPQRFELVPEVIHQQFTMLRGHSHHLTQRRGPLRVLPLEHVPQVAKQPRSPQRPTTDHHSRRARRTHQPQRVRRLEHVAVADHRDVHRLSQLRHGGPSHGRGVQLQMRPATHFSATFSFCVNSPHEPHTAFFAPVEIWAEKCRRTFVVRFSRVGHA